MVTKGRWAVDLIRALALAEEPASLRRVGYSFLCSVPGAAGRRAGVSRIPRRLASRSGPPRAPALVLLVHFTSRGKVNQMLKSARSTPKTPIATAQNAAQIGAAPPVTTCGKLPEK